jgi:hypothetical protein
LPATKGSFDEKIARLALDVFLPEPRPARSLRNTHGTGNAREFSRYRNTILLESDRGRSGSHGQKPDAVKKHARVRGIGCLVIAWIGAAALAVPIPLFAAEAPQGGFMDRRNMTLRGDLPFETAWIKPGVPWTKYRKVVILPVDTKHLLESDVWQELGRSGDIRKDVSKIANYARAVFEQAFISDPEKRFRIVYSLQPNPDTLRVEMALTELTPNKIFLKAAGYVPLYGWVAKAVNQTNKSYVSIEIRLRDAKTGEILAKFADKKSEPFTLVNVNQFNWYGFAEKRIDEWSVKLVETLNRKPGQVVSKSSSFDLGPW